MANFPFPLRYPIFQAPTGSIAGPELCGAVSEAWAMGAMGLTWTAPEEAGRLVTNVRVRLGSGVPFLVNFVLHFPPDALDTALDAGAPVVSFSWGNPLPFVAKVRAAGAYLGVQVTSREGAIRALETVGPDFLLCQGNEAGGHVQASEPLARTLPEIVAVAGKVPVVAAGGIATGEGIARVLQEGASGAMLGTRFVACRESRAHPAYKNALVRASGAMETALTLCFDGGWPNAAHRVLRNSTLTRWESHGSPKAGERPGEGDQIARTATGEAILRYEDTAPREGMVGDLEAMCLYAGCGVGEINDLPDAAAIVARLIAEMQAAMTV